MTLTKADLLIQLLLHTDPAKARTPKSWHDQATITQATLRTRKISQCELEGDIYAELATWAKERWPAATIPVAVLYAIESLTDDANDEHRARRTTGCTLETLDIIDRWMTYIKKGI